MLAGVFHRIAENRAASHASFYCGAPFESSNSACRAVLLRRVDRTCHVRVSGLGSLPCARRFACFARRQFGAFVLHDATAPLSSADCPFAVCTGLATTFSCDSRIIRTARKTYPPTVRPKWPRLSAIAQRSLCACSAAMSSAAWWKDARCRICPVELNKHARKVDNTGVFSMKTCFGVEGAGDKVWLCAGCRRNFGRHKRR